jgi:predicted amidohydrolase
MVNIGIIQMEPLPLRTDENIAKAERLLGEVVDRDAQIVVLPEMFNVGFYFGESLMAVAETMDGPTIAWLKDQAQKYHIFITCSFYEQFGGYFYNTMVMIGYDGSLQYYRKRNPTWQERLVWRRADEPGPGIFDTPFGRIGGVICFDSFAQETHLGFLNSQVDMVVIIACWGHPRPASRRPDLALGQSILNKWSHIAAEIVPFSHAIHLGVPVAFVNNAGVTKTPAHFPPPHFWPFGELEFEFYGGSHVLDKLGAEKVRAGQHEVEFTAVVPVEIHKRPYYPKPIRTEVPLGYLSRDYYFVQPPLLAKVFQKWCYDGFAQVYEERCRRNSGD